MPGIGSAMLTGYLAPAPIGHKLIQTAEPIPPRSHLAATSFLIGPNLNCRRGALLGIDILEMSLSSSFPCNSTPIFVISVGERLKH